MDVPKSKLSQHLPNLETVVSEGEASDVSMGPYEVKSASLGQIKNYLSTSVSEELDLANPNCVFEKMKKLRGFVSSIIKKPLWKNDALILRIRAVNSDADFSLKVHPDIFPLARKVYSNSDLIAKVNSHNWSSYIHETFILTSFGRDYRVVLYDFLEGIPLRSAILNNKINFEKAFQKLKELEGNFRGIKIFLHLRDGDDFLLQENGCLKLTDWAAIDDISDVPENKMQDYDPSESVRSILV